MADFSACNTTLDVCRIGRVEGIDGFCCAFMFAIFFAFIGTLVVFEVAKREINGCDDVGMNHLSVEMVETGSPQSQESPHSEDGANHGSCSVREQDRFLPIANISRIIKRALPANAKIAKDAKETVQECVSEFISFITSEASDKCQREKRKTINGDDLLWAMTTLGFDDYVEPLKLYLQKLREAEGDKGAIGHKVAAESCDGKEGFAISGGPVQMAHTGLYNSDVSYVQAQMH